MIDLSNARDLVKRRFAPTWRYGFNLGPTVEHRRHPIPLDAEARRVLADLERDGLATSTLEALTGDPTLLAQLQQEAKELETAQEAMLAERRRQMVEGGADAKKEFVVHLLGRQPVIDPEGLLAQTALDPQLRGVADAYFGLRTSIADVNIWRNLQTTQEPKSSQLWHRDLMQDHYLVKVFIHLEDVELGTGPFHFAKGTHSKGDTKVRAPGDFDGVTSRSDDAQLATVIPADRVVQCTGPAGTVLFTDTVGYHRGGWARTEDRLVFHALYTSRASSNDYMLRLQDPSQRARWEHDFVLRPTPAKK